jgi:uncharacterized protein (TIGR03663 family)
MARRDFLFPAFILLLGIGLRLWLLDLKPPHFDEGINGWFCDQMAIKGFYAYDPTNYHGPLHFYVLYLFLQILGRNLWALRLPVVIVSSVTIFWLFLFRPFFGRLISWGAALGMAISPAFVFYNRYSIHETWLVFFLVLSFWGFLGVFKSQSPLSWWGLILGITGMILTKETFIIHVASFLLAYAVLFVLRRFTKKETEPPRENHKIPFKHLGGAIAVGVFFIVFFYSGNFRNWEGLRGLVGSFLPWTKTAVDAAGHAKTDYDLFPILPFLPAFKLNWYWIKLLSVYEWFGLAGLLYSLRFWFGGNTHLRLLAIYGLAVLGIYSLIPYKTPWCIISIEWPFLFFGSALIVLIAKHSNKWVAFALSLVLFAQSSWGTIRLNFFKYDDPKEMFVYVQTFRDYKRLIDPILEKVRKEPDQYAKMNGLILLSSYYPIPWLLGGFSDIGYYNSGDRWPRKKDADFVVVDSDLARELEKSLTDRYFVVPFRLRDGMDECRVYFRYETFKDIFPNRQPDFDPAKPAPAKVEEDSDDDNDSSSE